MSEYSWFGDHLPHDEESAREHRNQVAEDLRREREADRLAKTHERKRPRWKFWAKG